MNTTQVRFREQFELAVSSTRIISLLNGVSYYVSMSFPGMNAGLLSNCDIICCGSEDQTYVTDWDNACF